MLIVAGANVNTLDNLGWTPLHAAADKNNIVETTNNRIYYYSEVSRLVCSQLLYQEDKWRGMILSEKIWYKHCLTFFVFCS